MGFRNSKLGMRIHSSCKLRKQISKRNGGTYLCVLVIHTLKLCSAEAQRGESRPAARLDGNERSELWGKAWCP